MKTQQKIKPLSKKEFIAVLQEDKEYQKMIIRGLIRGDSLIRKLNRKEQTITKIAAIVQAERQLEYHKKQTLTTKVEKQLYKLVKQHTVNKVLK